MSRVLLCIEAKQKMFRNACEDALHTMNNETLIVLTPDDKLVDFQASNKKNCGLETIRGAMVIDIFWPSSKWKMTDLHFPR